MTWSRLLAAPSTTAGLAVGFASDSGGAAALAQGLQDLHTLIFARPWPARDLVGCAHTANAASSGRIKRADADAG
jgi:hypothetical protein